LGVLGIEGGVAGGFGGGYSGGRWWSLAVFYAGKIC